MKRDIIAIIGCILSSIWILAICVQCAIGPDQYPPKYDPKDHDSAILQVLP